MRTALFSRSGGQETTPNLIGNGMLSLLRHPDQMYRLRQDPTLLASAIEELLRYEAPSQHTTRIAPDDVQLGSRHIRKQQPVIAVMGAANRDPDRLSILTVSTLAGRITGISHLAQARISALARLWLAW